MSVLRYILTLIFMPLFITTWAQPKAAIRKGNKLYEQKQYKEAAALYQEALKENPSYTPGLYNLGNSLYQQKQYEASRKAMEAATKMSKSEKEKAASHYNIGNSYMAEQKWQEAVNAYKQSLKNNPQDENAKYNLSYALQKLKQQQNNGGGKDDKKDKDNKEQDKKDQQQRDKQDKKEDDKDQQQQNKQDKKEDDKQGKDKPQPQPSKLSEKQAEQILNALQQEEKKLHDKKEKGTAIPIKVEKDW